MRSRPLKRPHPEFFQNPRMFDGRRLREFQSALRVPEVFEGFKDVSGSCEQVSQRLKRVGKDRAGAPRRARGGGASIRGVMEGDAPRASGVWTLLAVAGDIKLAHSVFALPFAVLGMFLACGWAGRLPRWGEVGLVVLCMVLARTWAMAMNRWADADFDQANPRTAGRAIPSGRVSAWGMLAVVGGCGVLFCVAAEAFWWIYGNLWPAVLALPVLGWLALYSFTKRWTWACHGVLGVALAMSPVAAAVAVEPSYLGDWPVWVLAGSVACWVAGFDVVYALQDVAVDRAGGLWSLPSRLGEGRALWIARGLHVAAGAGLIGLMWVSPPLGWAWLAAATATAGLLVVEHALVWGSRTHRLDVAFLTVNGVISLLLGAVGVWEVVWEVI